MAFRSDVSVEWWYSPRLITVAAPSLTISIQDLVDTLRRLEEKRFGSYPSILDADGKSDVGSGNKTGITVKLINARLAFEQRTTPNVTGSATSSDANGVQLVDTGATFVTDGVQPGDTLWNTTDLSFATVLEVIDENTIKHRKLAGGSGNNWDISDAYRIYTTEQGNITGGNLVAVDDVGDPLNPVFPTAFTQVTRELSVSPSIAGASIADDLWDSLLADHTDPNTFGGRLNRLRFNRV